MSVASPPFGPNTQFKSSLVSFKVDTYNGCCWLSDVCRVRAVDWQHAIDVALEEYDFDGQLIRVRPVVSGPF